MALLDFLNMSPNSGGLFGNLGNGQVAGALGNFGTGLTNWLQSNPNEVYALASGLTSAPNLRSGISNAAGMMPQAKQADIQYRGLQATQKMMADPNTIPNLTPAMRAWLVNNPQAADAYLTRVMTPPTFQQVGVDPQTGSPEYGWVSPTQQTVTPFSLSGSSGSPSALGLVPDAGGPDGTTPSAPADSGAPPASAPSPTGDTAGPAGASAPSTDAGASGKSASDAGASPDLSASTKDYTTKPVAGGATQAAIDQAALYNLSTGQRPTAPRAQGPAMAYYTAVLNRMAQIGGNLGLNQADFKALGASLTQQTQYLNNIQRAFTTANETIASVVDWMKQNNINPSQYPDLNSMANVVAAHGGNVGPIRGFQSQINQLRSEYAMILARNGQMNQTIEDAANKLIPDNISPADLQTLGDRLNVDANNAISAAQQQVDSIRAQLAGQPAVGRPPQGSNSQSPASIPIGTVANPPPGTNGPIYVYDGTQWVPQ